MNIEKLIQDVRFLTMKGSKVGIFKVKGTLKVLIMDATSERMIRYKVPFFGVYDSAIGDDDLRSDLEDIILGV